MNQNKFDIEQLLSTYSYYELSIEQKQFVNEQMTEEEYDSTKELINNLHENHNIDIQSRNLSVDLKTSLLDKHTAYHKSKTSSSKSIFRNRKRVYQIAAVFIILIMAGTYIIADYLNIDEDISIEEFNEYSSAEDYFFNEEFIMLGSNSEVIDDIEQMNEFTSYESYIESEEKIYEPDVNFN